MQLRKLCVSTSWFLFCLILVLASAVRTSAQSDSPARQKDKRVVIIDGSTAQVLRFTAIPEATEPCVPAVCEWWNNIRKANADINLGYMKKKEKAILEARERFFLLLYEGQQKGYQVPLKDRPPQPLLSGWPRYSFVAQKNRIQGEVVLAIQIWIDGTVGDVQVTKGLGSDMDKSAIEAARQALFLPAVKNRAFVAQQSTAKFGFTLGCAGCRP